MCPWLATKGTSMPKSWFTAQPATNPPAVTKVPWARLTMPPSPVTTTNDRKTMASAMPGREDAQRLEVAGLRPAPREPLERERHEQEHEDRPREQRAATAGRPSRWSSMRLLVRHRAPLAPAVAPDHEQQDHGEDERDRGAEPGEIVEEPGEDGVAVAVDEVLQDAEEQSAGERDRDRPEPGERHRRERARARSG